MRKSSVVTTVLDHRCTASILEGRGQVASPSGVHRSWVPDLMSSFSGLRPKRTPGTPAFDDLVQRQFPTAAANRLWLDITEHPTGEGKLYLCAIKDSSQQDRRLLHRPAYDGPARRLGPPKNAVAWRCRNGTDVAGCIVHADRGSQFRLPEVPPALTRPGLIGSMGRVASAADNAAMESFFSLLQKNVLDRQPWRTREELRIAIVTWIERTYHRRRRQGASADSPPSSTKRS